MTMQIAVLGSIFMHSLPIEFYNLYIFFASKESFYTQIKLFITISLIYTGFKWNGIHCMNSKPLQNGIFKIVDGSSSFSLNDVIMHGVTAFGHIGKKVYWSPESRSLRTNCSFLQLMHQSIIETLAPQPCHLAGNVALAAC